MSHPVAPIDGNLSERIACVRVLCIIGMIYVHVPGVADNAVDRVFDASAPFASIQAFIVESFGRASAALLSVLSGWLCARTLLGGVSEPSVSRPSLSDVSGAARRLVRSRFHSTLVPMIFWASLTMVVFAAVSLVRPTFLAPDGAPLGATLWRYVNHVFFLTDAPAGATLHLSFLRDLFVCVLVAPLLLVGLTRHAIPIVLALGVLYLADLSSVIILRPLILFAFALGMWAAVRGASPRLLDGSPVRWLVLTGLLTIAVMWANAGYLDAIDQVLAAVGLDLRASVLYPLSRLFGSLSVWCIAAYVVSRSLGRLLRAQSPWLFTTYCGHYLILIVLYIAVWSPLSGSAESGPLYFMWFLVAPAIALLVAQVALRVIDRWLPKLAPIVGSGMGKPVGKRQSGSSALQPVPPEDPESRTSNIVDASKAKASP